MGIKSCKMDHKFQYSQVHTKFQAENLNRTGSIYMDVERVMFKCIRKYEDICLRWIQLAQDWGKKRGLVNAIIEEIGK